MKNLPFALASCLALASSAFAGAPSKPATHAERPDDAPVVAKVVNPSLLPESFTRSVLEVRFSLNEQGQPQNVRVISPTDAEVKKQVVKAFKAWRFEVASVDTASKRYVLPLDIIPEV